MKTITYAPPLTRDRQLAQRSTQLRMRLLAARDRQVDMDLLRSEVHRTAYSHLVGAIRHMVSDHAAEPTKDSLLAAAETAIGEAEAALDLLVGQMTAPVGGVL